MVALRGEMTVISSRLTKLRMQTRMERLAALARPFDEIGPAMTGTQRVRAVRRTGAAAPMVAGRRRSRQPALDHRLLAVASA